MFKSLIPALTVALLGQSIASAQYFGAQNPSPSGYRQLARPIRIARATDNELPTNPTEDLNDLDGLDDLDALDALQDAPTEDVPALAPAATGQAINSPQSPQLLEPVELPKLQEIPEKLELPLPAPADQPASPSDSNSVQPEISAKDLEALQPAPEPRSLVEPAPAPASPILGPIDFNEAIQQQQQDLTHSQYHTDPSQYFGAAHHASSGSAFHASAGCGPNGHSACGCAGGLTPLPYRAPILPASNSFHGHFRANPCYYDVWANYPAEAAAACAHNRAKLAPRQKIGCQTCELVDPRPCR